MSENNNNIQDISLELCEIKNKLEILVKIYLSNKFPKVLLLSGSKGIGKFTLVKHLMHCIFDKDNYNLDKGLINNQTCFSKQFNNGTFPNIVYLPGLDFKAIKIQDIRNLKSQLLKSTILNNKRFVILDDVERFNTNSLNALLKIIEEPTENNFFILINNKTKPLLKTIISRSLEFKYMLSDESRLKIIDYLIKKNNLEVQIDYNAINLTPGSFLIFNNILLKNKIDINGDFLLNLETILNLYKKRKDLNLINLLLLLTDYYFHVLNKKKVLDIENIAEKKSFVINNINNLVIYNLNQTSIINAINNKLFNG
tara:strand:+ start:71 stop:1006 length:936 start_codon:yes stop_codon:yes gene_type:complete